jgi:hypothetical protein
MQLPQLTTPLRKKAPRRVRNDRRRAPRAPEPPQEPRIPVERRDARRAGYPEDTAFYSCGCGYAFTAAVTTAVDCPHCGAEQAW